MTKRVILWDMVAGWVACMLLMIMCCARVAVVLF